MEILISFGIYIRHINVYEGSKKRLEQRNGYRHRD